MLLVIDTEKWITYQQRKRESHLTRKGWGKQLEVCVLTTSWRFNKFVRRTPLPHLSIFVTTICMTTHFESGLESHKRERHRVVVSQNRERGCDPWTALMSSSNSSLALSLQTRSATGLLWHLLATSHYCTTQLIHIHMDYTNTGFGFIQDYISYYIMNELLCLSSLNYNSIILQKAANEEVLHKFKTNHPLHCCTELLVLHHIQASAHDFMLPSYFSNLNLC